MSMPGETMKEVTAMNIDVVDVRLDERKLPYLVSETVAEYRGEYVGEQRLKVNSPEKVVNVLNNVFHMKDFSDVLICQSSCDNLCRS